MHDEVGLVEAEGLSDAKQVGILVDEAHLLLVVAGLDDASGRQYYKLRLREKDHVLLLKHRRNQHGFVADVGHEFAYFRYLHVVSALLVLRVHHCCFWSLSLLFFYLSVDLTMNECLFVK